MYISNINSVSSQFCRATDDVIVIVRQSVITYKTLIKNKSFIHSYCKIRAGAPESNTVSIAHSSKINVFVVPQIFSKIVYA